MKFVCAALFSLVTLGIVGSFAEAQCGIFRHRRAVSYYSYPTTYQYPVREVVEYPTIIPVAVPVLVPAFQFQYVAPTAPCVTPGFGSAVTPGFGAAVTPGFGAPVTPGLGMAPQGVQMQPASYAPGGQQVGGVTEQERIALLAKAIIVEMNKQLGDSGGDQGPPMATEGSQNQSQPSVPQGPYGSVPQQFNHLNVFANRCAGCHTGPTAKAGIQIFTSPGVFNTGIDRQRVLRAVTEGRMPPQGVSDPQFRLQPNELVAIQTGLR